MTDAQARELRAAIDRNKVLAIKLALAQRQRSPLTDAEITAHARTGHFPPETPACLEWYRMGVRDAEKFHGISHD
jgi:hypothetical protein